MSADYPTPSAYDGGDPRRLPPALSYPRNWSVDGSMPQSRPTGLPNPAMTYADWNPAAMMAPPMAPSMPWPTPPATQPDETRSSFGAASAVGQRPSPYGVPPAHPDRVEPDRDRWVPDDRSARDWDDRGRDWPARDDWDRPARDDPDRRGQQRRGRDDRSRDDRGRDDRGRGRGRGNPRDQDLEPYRRSNARYSQMLDEEYQSEGRGERAWAPSLGRYKLQVRSLRILWSTIFFAVIFLPLVLAPRAGGEVRPWSRGGIAIELCLTTGLLGLSTLAATVILPSRMRTILKAFGIEGVLNSHKLLALVTTGLVLIHVMFVAVDRPANVMLLWPVTGPPRARAGEAATISMIFLCWLSLRRRKMGTRYELWRMGHALLAVVAIAGTYVHIYFLNHLMQDVAERSVFLAILLFIAGVFGNRWILRPLRAQRRAYVIREVRSETQSTSTMVLTPARRGQRILKYRAGQFAWIRLDSPFGPLQGHPFTIASAPHNKRELHFTIRNAGDFTGSVVVLTPGRKVFVDGPYGDFNDDHMSCKSLLLISGGIGITPMMSLLRSHAHRRDRRRHVLLSCAQTESELMFRDELRHLEQIMNLKVIEVLSRPAATWRGVRGRLNEEILAGVLDEQGLRKPAVFICGPPAMMKSTRAALNEVGFDDRHIHTEDFAMV
ncbi:MAG TPA: ferric reductase-like transmembrane domain-containing protein [Kineosporiaceae bacterium]